MYDRLLANRGQILIEHRKGISELGTSQSLLIILFAKVCMPPRDYFGKDLKQNCNSQKVGEPNV